MLTILSSLGRLLFGWLGAKFLTNYINKILEGIQLKQNIESGNREAGAAATELSEDLKSSLERLNAEGAKTDEHIKRGE